MKYGHEKTRTRIPLWSFTRNVISLQYTIKNVHNDDKCHLFLNPLSDNKFMTYSDKEAIIKVWKGEAPYSDTPIKVISIKGQKFFILDYIREREYLLVEEYQKHLILVYLCIV